MKILFIVHDCSRTGAPMNLLHLIRGLVEKHNVIPYLVIHMEHGELLNEFKILAKKVIVYRSYTDNKEGITNKVRRRSVFIKNIYSKLAKENIEVIYSNTITNGGILSPLKKILKCPVYVHVHELDNVINAYGNKNWEQNLKFSDGFIAVSNAVKNNLIKNRNVDENKICLVKEFIDVNSVVNYNFENKLKKLLNLKDTTKVIGGSGLVGNRKGTDIFVDTAKEFFKCDTETDVVFVWIGKLKANLEFFNALQKEVKDNDLINKVLFIDLVADPFNYYKDFDIFYLPSREDPYPLVCLENAALSKPIICFEEGGGIPEFVGNEAGYSVSYLNIIQASDKMKYLIDNPSVCLNKGQIGFDRVSKDHDIDFNVKVVLDFVQS